MYKYEEFEKLLNSRGITIYRVAVDTGINKATLYEWKNGTYTPKIDKLLKIAKYFNVPIETFIK